jgi:signal transduction histidine kinase
VTGLRSLRARFLVGSILWTIGLLAVAHMTFVALVEYMPQRLFIRHWTALSIVALAFLLGGLSQVRRGLSPVNQLRARLGAIGAGASRRLDGTYPTEVQPLVDDLNALLEHREQAVVRARARAADFAHGLKTPLAVLANEADRVEAAGQPELAGAIRQQVERMRRQTEYHLAQARASASGPVSGARAVVADAAGALARTLARLHEGRGLDLQVRVPTDHAVRVQSEDLEEMLGNLMDNACKWAASKVVVSSTGGESTVVIAVEDDGPGIADELKATMLDRGTRADEAAPGSGLGLAITRNLAALYGGSLSLRTASNGGLRATLTLPPA